MRLISTKLTPVLLLLLLPFWASAQAGFSTEPSVFAKEFADFFSVSKTKEVLELSDQFVTDFTTLFSREEQDTVIHFVNLLKARRYRPNPDMVAYAKMVTLLKKKSPAKFLRWHQIAKTILQKDSKPDKTLKKFIRFMGPFLAEKSFKDPKRGGIVWSVTGDDYEIDFAEDILAIKFKEVNLSAVRHQDSLEIAKTSGQYRIKSNKWLGNGGRSYWTKAGQPDVYAELGPYQVDCSKGLYRADSVKFFYPFLMPGPMIGTLEDKVVKSSDRVSYPKFVSDSESLVLKNIANGITMQGGVKVEGSRIYVFSTKGRNALLELKKPQNNQKVFRCRGKSFRIRKEDKISGKQVETSIYFRQDSVYHPSVTVIYSIKENILRMSREDRGSDRNPFYNSYYQVNIDVDKIAYDINSEKIIVGDKKLSLDKVKNEVSFESVSFYDEETYIRYRGVAETNPIAVLLRLSTETGETEFSESEAGQRINPRVPPENNKRLWYQMASDGFIFYDTDNGRIILRDKLFHYGRASTGNADYDPINIVSKSKDANAVFDIKKGKTEINEVSSLVLSRKQSVAMRPDSNRLTMLKNRDMKFDGVLYAGMAVFTGKDMYFNYDRFTVKMDSVRYLDFYVPTGKLLKNKRKEAISIDSRIEYLTGYLLVDAPQNKSGRKDIKIFPSFASKDHSFVYYDRKDIVGGAYKRDSFYFKLDKFTFNGLDDYHKEDLKFKGEMFSADILPPFKETIVLRDDLSYGFVTNSPSEGWPLYGARGKYLGEVDLSNKGFWGKGEVNYLTSSVRSEDILFKPREMTCTGKIFEMTEDRMSSVKVPQVHGDTVSVVWKPYLDSMLIRTKEKPFDMFKTPGYFLDGTLVLTPKGAKGIGLFDWEGGELRSRAMNFDPFKVYSDTADLRIKAIGEAGIALNTKNLNSTLDFDQMMGYFKANNDSVVTVLPQNEYTTTMNRFDWDMKKGLILFKSTPGTLARFTSINKSQDSLTFEGQTAQYNLKTAELNIGGVPYIRSCDAIIYTGDGKVDIEKGAKIRTLTNARIVADTTNKYHEFKKVTVDILGKKDYKAKGYYVYDLPTHKQEILFENIIGQRYGKGAHSEKPTLTTATTEIKQEDNFFIDEATRFKGTISLRANEKKLNFDGFAMLDVPRLRDNWFSIRSKGDKKNLVINLNKPKSPAGEPLAVGVFLSKETAQMYPRMIQPLRLRKDRPILDCMGQFRYDGNNNAFIFGDSTRVNKYGDQGNIMTYFVNKKVVKGNGKLNLGDGLEYTSIHATGTVETTVSEDSTAGTMLAEIMAGFEFDFPEALARVVWADLESSMLDLREAAYENSFYTKVLPNFITNRKDLIKAKKGITARSIPYPKSFNKYKIIFSKLKMKWLPEYQSFMTTTKRNNLGVFDGHPVNKLIRSYVEIKMPSSGDDRFYIYFKLPNDNFYFFGYQGGILSTCSNNPVFEETAKKMKAKNFKFKKGKNKYYVVETVNPLTAQLFVKRVNTAISGN